MSDGKLLYKGLSLYPSIIRKIETNEGTLLKAGYKESKKKPLLFYMSSNDCIFFADMRGTEIVPIWDDTSPLFYAQFKNTYPEWKQRRLLKLEIERLSKVGCDVRLSFFAECEPDGIMFDSEEDGYCKWCGKDFGNKGLYCSEKCENNARRKDLTDIVNYAPVCESCKRKIIDYKRTYEEIVELLPDLVNKIVYSKVISHHTSYKEDITMTVCSSCHGGINKIREWAPVDSRPKKQPKTKLVPCSCYGCTKKARVSYNATEEEIKNACCSRCKSRGGLPHRGLHDEARRRLVRENLVSFEEQSKEYICPGCHEVFKNMEKLKDHLRFCYLFQHAQAKDVIPKLHAIFQDETAHKT